MAEKKITARSKHPNYKPKMGRPTKFCKEITDKIIGAVAMGNYLEVAASYAGVSKDSLHKWMKKGARAKSGIYKDFSDSIEKAMAASEMRDVKNITKAADDGQWTASAWRLERKHTQRWGRKDRVELTGKDGGAIEITDPRQVLRDRVAGIAGRIEEGKST